MKKLITVLFFSALTTTTIWAQSPEQISYQAIIRNNEGVLIQNENAGLKISMLKGSADGDAVYVETHLTTTNNNGLISLSIGLGEVVVGNFTSIDWENGPFFIKTETDPNGGSNYSIVGTTQLLSVPYALYSQKSDTSNYSTNSKQMLTEIKRAYNSEVLNDHDGFRIFNASVETDTVDNFASLSFIARNTWLAKAAISGVATDVDEMDIVFQNEYDAPGDIHETFRIKAHGRLEVKKGDVYIENMGSGIITKSPDGNCWRITVSNSGGLETSAITCP
jgi:hypothetical protein